jgi:sugar phosphate isomerase/epimerase
MKLAFSTNAFKKYSLKESIRLIREIGYDGVEILCDIPHAYPPCLDEEDILSIKETVSKNKIEISNLNAFTLYAITDVYHPSWIESDNRLRELRIQHTIDCLDLARKLGAKNISIIIIIIIIRVIKARATMILRHFKISLLTVLSEALKLLKNTV